MSLINQMLKDIDKRQAGSESRPQLEGHAHIVAGPASPVTTVLLTSILMVLLIGLGFYFTRGGSSPTVAPAPIPVVITTAPPVQVAATPAPSPAPAAEAIAVPSQAPAVTAPAPAPTPAKAPTATSPPATSAGASRTKSATPAISKESASSSAVTKTPTNEQRSINLMVQAKQLLRQSQPAEARSLLEQALAMHATNQEARQLLAHAHLQLNDLDKAIEALKAGLVSTGNSPDYHAFLGALLQRKGQHEEAMRHYVAALQRAPDNANWLVGLAISLQAQNMSVGAKEAYERALALGTLSSDLAAFAQRRLSQLNK